MTPPLAVITGAARGIGRQLAQDLITEGYRVVIGDLDLAATTATATELGQAATPIRLDVTDAALLAEAIERIETEIGPIDLWINNAGIMPTGPFVGQAGDAQQRIIAINYAAVVTASALVVPRMVARGRGTLVNMASATGIKPLAGVAVYSGTKAAVIAFSDALRRELRKTGVRVTVVMPNLVTTAMGAGITPPRLTGAVSAADVSRATVRAIERGRFWVVVPRGLGPVLRISKLLPFSWQDWIDDRAGSDNIGLGGDPAVRDAYAKDVLGD
ncbi:SDR family NAD(P)-dependent oxidoreductase [Salinibacterium soli]|uniref:SDR family NAD(P)-dependent oxidoreductase n=1 Tax=Antiquaquibacter soli TaxID=3064523 RepID=A0ABT9BP98_9MICO|nr:SDR family NAD(P)-dependent oxidoreductase [Protaetiibacter sp. WY-16]MDO7881245.1 SDR family NAD(P)-dependent oxidoreductase [Protaetiibacter sp. WY-16]